MHQRSLEAINSPGNVRQTCMLVFQQSEYVNLSFVSRKSERYKKEKAMSKVNNSKWRECIKQWWEFYVNLVWLLCVLYMSILCDYTYHWISHSIWSSCKTLHADLLHRLPTLIRVPKIKSLFTCIKWKYCFFRLYTSFGFEFLSVSAFAL